MSNIKELRLKEYDQSYENYKRIETIVAGLLEKTVAESNISIMQITHRIKSRDSVAEKLERKPEKYKTVNMMNDLIGFRIICYFSDQVDEIARLVEKVLTVDREKSSDKRKLISPTAFGYLSLHFICSLPENAGYPEELLGYTFEIQFRTVLQHAWAEIEHDLGYKTEFGIPVDVRREFSRVAGLLEIADESFENIRSRIGEYEKWVHESIKDDRADKFSLDLVTLKEFVRHSQMMKSFLEEICAFSGATMMEVSPENYLERLAFFNIRTLGDLSAFMELEREHAIMLAQSSLAATELDELATTVGLYYLCKAHLVFQDYRDEELKNYFRTYITDDARIDREVNRIKQLRKRYTDV